tara:strand:- start:116 stop:781 length:666 start_codon:yes stop_codon:yes gene_type:complete
MSKVKNFKIPLDERVARELEEDIIFGRLQPGERLREGALLERFGGTRHFMRQSLARLERSGIVVLERNKGAMVRTFSAEEVGHIYEVREMLHRRAALCTPLPASEELIEELKAINDEYCACIAANDLRGIHETNDAFHKAQLSACTNPYLRELIFEYMDITLAIRAKNLANPARLKESIEHHRLIIKYLQGTDSWMLAELSVDHIKPSKKIYIEVIKNRKN